MFLFQIPSAQEMAAAAEYNLISLGVGGTVALVILWLYRQDRRACAARERAAAALQVEREKQVAQERVDREMKFSAERELLMQRFLERERETTEEFGELSRQFQSITQEFKEVVKDNTRALQLNADTINTHAALIRDLTNRVIDLGREP